MSKMQNKSVYALTGLLVLSGAIAVRADSQFHYSDAQLRTIFDNSVRYTDAVEFPNRIGAQGDVTSGALNFGLTADGTQVNPDNTAGLFQGPSQIAGNVVSNGRTCSTCHLPQNRLGLPPAPLSAHIAATDALFTGVTGDSGPDPLGPVNLDTLGLIEHRPGRLNPILPPEQQGFQQLIVWRKSNHLLNTVFTFGILNEGRARDLVEAARGAAMTHTQTGDLRFDDITNANNNQRLKDIAAFIEAQIDPPELADLLDESAPLHDALINDPFYTVHTHTFEQRMGQVVFEHNCMSCHNMPNVFSNRDHVNGPPLAFPPDYGHTFDIGVSERNAHHLDFRRYDAATGTRIPVVLPLIRQDGAIVNFTVVDDPGTAGATGRYEDLHRFKVPQLRHVAEMAPYFHDNSAATLEEVVDYFNSDQYNNSLDGRDHPIHLSHFERDALLSFLRIL